MSDAPEPCTEACEVWPECSTCHRIKAPRGRSLPLEMCGGYCDHDCAGYLDVPTPGHLFPGELARKAVTRMDGGSWETDECIHGLGPVTACVICNGRERQERLARFVADPEWLPFPAKFFGRCPACDRSIDTGEALVRTGSGEFIHERCQYRPR